MMDLVIAGLLSFVLFLILAWVTFREAKAVYDNKKEYSFKRIIFFSTVSMFLVITSLGLLIWGIYLLDISEANSTQSTKLFSISSWTLTVGFASIIYYTQALESKNTLNKLGDLLKEFNETNQQLASSSTDKTLLGHLGNTDEFIDLKDEIKRMLVDRIRLEVKKELEINVEIDSTVDQKNEA